MYRSPLYSLLLALGNPTVDYFSLDIEGAEYEVLRNIPWDKVDIRALSVETQFAGEVGTGSREDIIQLLTDLGYTHLDTISRDDVFVKLEPGGVSPKITAEEVLKKSNERHCVYFRVPGSKLSSHCRHHFPRDYYQVIRNLSKQNNINLIVSITRIKHQIFQTVLLEPPVLLTSSLL